MLKPGRAMNGKTGQVLSRPVVGLSAPPWPFSACAGRVDVLAGSGSPGEDPLLSSARGRTPAPSPGGHALQAVGPCSCAAWALPRQGLGRGWAGVPGDTPLPAPRALTPEHSLRELQNAPDTIPESGVEPPPLDTAWVEATRKKALLKLEKLDTDLKNYKGNSIKESIRCCSREAGRLAAGTAPVALGQVRSHLALQARPRRPG